MEKTFIGIDVSSHKLDISVSSEGTKRSFVIENAVKAITEFFKPYRSSDCYVALENTGRYNWPFYQALSSFEGHIYVVSPLHLKRSMGLTRGKNDKIDAIRINDFIQKNYPQLTEWKPLPEVLKQIKILLSERNLRIRQKKQADQQLGYYPFLKHTGLDKELIKLNKQLVKTLKAQILALEKKIEQLIESDQTLTTQASLIRSVPGVGKVLTWSLLSSTEGFQKITEPRKLACFCGVVPFEHQSGTSVRGRTRVSSFANKQLKSILQLAAMRAVRLNNDLQIYYLRKVGQGKNKMAVLNAVRNKIIHRVYAVIKQNKPYQNNLVLS